MRTKSGTSMQGVSIDSIISQSSSMTLHIKGHVLIRSMGSLFWVKFNGDSTQCNAVLSFLGVSAVRYVGKYELSSCPPDAT